MVYNDRSSKFISFFVCQIILVLFKVTNIGQIILETLENLIHIDLNSISEDEFLSKHAVMKQNAVKSIFEHFLSDHSIDSNIANHCYRILQEVISRWQKCSSLLPERVKMPHTTADS